MAVCRISFKKKLYTVHPPFPAVIKNNLTTKKDSVTQNIKQMKLSNETIKHS